MRRRLTGIGAWALRLNWLLGISALMVTTGLGFSPAKASGRRCSCHQQGGEFGVRDTASEQTLGASVTSVIAAFAAGLALSACATAGTTVTQSGEAANGTPVPAVTGGQRDLTPQEKKVIVDAISPSLRNPGGAKYRWAKFPTVVSEETVNYCAMVDAQSPYAAYSGRQAYIVEAHLTGGHVSGAVIGLIAGGKDVTIVNEMCAKYGLDPKSAS